MTDKGEYLESDEVIRRLQIYFDKYNELFTTWAAKVLDLQNHPDTRLSGNLQSQLGDRRDGKYYWHLSIERGLSIHQIFCLIVLAWYTPEEVRKLIFFGIEEIIPHKNLLRHPSLSLLMKSKTIMILFLQQHQISADSLFGTLEKLIQRIRNEVEYRPNRLREKPTIFSLPFWRKLEQEKVTRYTGYSKHFKDQGSPRPDIEYLTNIIDDDAYQTDLFRKRQLFYKSGQDLYYFLLGGIT